MEHNYEMMPEHPAERALSSYLVAMRNDHLVLNDAAGESRALFHKHTLKRYELSAPEARIWELMEQPVTVGELVNVLLDEYGIDRLTCEAQVFSFLARLSEEKLVLFGMS